MGLAEFKRKRDFERTPEPQGRNGRRRRRAHGLIFVVQKHRASQLHYDFRLEWDGVLKSWAIPKGPALDPALKRFGRMVEDHPLEYADFEGVIPEGEYGGGTVMIWDHGTYAAGTLDVEESLRRGELEFVLEGKKLHGGWILIRMGRRGGRGRNWLLIKRRDPAASQEDITAMQPCSVVSGRSLAQIARDEGGDAERAATGDPPAARQCGQGQMRAAAAAERSGAAKTARARAKTAVARAKADGKRVAAEGKGGAAKDKGVAAEGKGVAAKEKGVAAKKRGEAPKKRGVREKSLAAKGRTASASRWRGAAAANRREVAAAARRRRRA